MKPSTSIAKCLRRCVLPLLPPRQRLPFKLWLYLRFEDPEVELLHLDRLPTRPGPAIDVGANMGFYALRMSRIFEQVYAFEINEEASRDLRACNLPNVEIIDVGLSNRVGGATLYIPVLQCGLQLNGWGSLQSGNCPDAKKHIEKNVTVRPLDDFEITACSFLKIDVEGHELSVLEGATQTITRCRPVILIEMRNQNESKGCQQLESLGYRRTELKHLAGTLGTPGNFIFLPE